MLLFPMMLNIFLNDIGRHLVSHGPHKKTILPQLATPELLLDLRIFSKNLRRRNTLQYPNHLRNRISRRKIQEQMHMIRGHFHLFYLKRKLFRNPLEQFLYSFSNINPFNPFSVLRSPYQVISRVVYGMTRPLNRHAQNLNIVRPRFAGQNFSSPPKGWGFQVLS